MEPHSSYHSQEISESTPLKAYLTLFGGFLMNMVCSIQCASTVNAWGTLSIYVVSYYYLQDSSVSLNMFLILYAVWCAGNCPGICKRHIDIAERVYKRFGVRAAALLAGAVFSSGFFISSFITNPYLFLVVFGIFEGVGEGLTLMTPVWSAWKYFPKNQGKATGAVLFGYGFGPSIFGIVFTFLANPHNEEATVSVTNGATTYYLFSAEVSNNIPSTLRYFALILAVIYLISVLLVSEPKTLEVKTGSVASIGKKAKGIPDCPDLTTAVRTICFWQLLAMLFFGLTYGVYILNVFKAFGQKFISNDHYLSVLGSIGTFCNALGRFFLPASLDYVSFKFTFCTSLIVQMAFSATFYSIASNDTLFALWLFVSFFASGGYFAIFAIECAKVFGPK